MGDVLRGKWKIRCNATKRNGEPCTSWAIHGGYTCRMHGTGGTPLTNPVRAKAEQRKQLIEDRIKELAETAAQAIQSVLENPEAKDADRIRAAETVLDRVVGKKIEAEIKKSEEADLDAEIEEAIGFLPEADEDIA